MNVLNDHASSTRPRRWTLGLLVSAALGALCTFASLPGRAAPGDTIPQAVQKGVNYLIPDVIDWTRSNGCIACHRQGGALYGLAVARSRGYNVSDDMTTGIGKIAADIAAEQRANGSWDHFGIWHRPKTSYAFFGLAAFDRLVSSLFSDDVLQAADYVLTVQNADGSWTDDHGSFPVDYGNGPLTARMIYGLVRAHDLGTPSQQAAYRGAIDRAVSYLRSIRDNRGNLLMRYNFQTSWAIIGLTSAGIRAGDADLDILVARQLAEASGDGFGWGYEAANNSDEFSTGLALTALCAAGVGPRDNARIQTALNWLNERQRIVNNDPTKGFWQSAGFSSVELPTTFALLGLSCFGELGVDVLAQAPTTVILNSDQATSQTATFNFTITNVGAFEVTDTYDLSLEGGFPGWTGTLSRSSITLNSGESGTVTLTVNAPPNLPQALPVEWELVATSRTENAISDSARVLTLTNPPPPTTGLASTVALTSGDGSTVITGSSQGVTLGARVTITSTGETVTGPSKGVVTFVVAGIAVGADNDADGDGIFTLNWRPTSRWAKTGNQRIRAVYSGIDQLDPNPDILGSQISGAIEIIRNPIQIDSVNPDTGRQGETLNVLISGTGFQNGVTVAFRQGITVNSVSLSAGASSQNELAPGEYVPARERQAQQLAAHQVLTVNISIAADAALGGSPVSVTNPDGSNLTEENAFTVGEGQSRGGKIQVQPKKQINFGRVRPGGTSRRVLKISNRSRDETLTGSLVLPAEVTVEGDVTAFSLQPGERAELTLIFTAGSGRGKYSDELTVNSSDPNKPSQTIRLKAKIK